MTIVVWVLSIQLWTDPPPKIQIVYNKEFTSHEECMQAREQYTNTKFTALCLMKNKQS